MAFLIVVIIIVVISVIAELFRTRAVNDRGRLLDTEISKKLRGLTFNINSE